MSGHRCTGMQVQVQASAATATRPGGCSFIVDKLAGTQSSNSEPIAGIDRGYRLSHEPAHALGGSSCQHASLRCNM